MKVLLADDHELVRDTIAAYLSTDAELEVVAVSNLQEALTKIESDGAYDLVLLDYSMPGMNGLDGLEKTIAANADHPVGILSGTASKAVAEEALAKGAAGFVPKTLAAKSLLHAVHFMIAGEQYAPLKFMTAEEPSAKDTELGKMLSPREFEVLEGLTKGMSNKEIAREIDLQEVTVKLHVKTLCRKLEAKNRTHAAMIAKDAGLF